MSYYLWRHTHYTRHKNKEISQLFVTRSMFNFFLCVIYSKIYLQTNYCINEIRGRGGEQSVKSYSWKFKRIKYGRIRKSIYQERAWRIKLQSLSKYKLEASCLNIKNNGQQQAQHDMTPESRQRKVEQVHITRKCGHNKLLDTIMCWNQKYTGDTAF